MAILREELRISDADMAAILRIHEDKDDPIDEDEVRRVLSIGLDECVDNALGLFKEGLDRRVEVKGKPLVVGSGNAIVAGQLMFGKGAFYADESDFEAVYGGNRKEISSIYVLSASGEKHAPLLVGFFSNLGLGSSPDLEPRVITCTPGSPAEKELVSIDHVFVTPKAAEPYTCNTSTYMGWLFLAGVEEPAAIRRFIMDEVNWALDPRMTENGVSNSGLNSFGEYDSFMIIVPNEFKDICGMYRTKYVEMFHPKVLGQVFTDEGAKHATTIIPSETQMFIGLGVDITQGEENDIFGRPDQRLYVPVPDGVGAAGMMAIGYHTIGKIQAEHPPMFRDNIVHYCLRQMPKAYGDGVQRSPVVR